MANQQCQRLSIREKERLPASPVDGRPKWSVEVKLELSDHVVKREIQDPLLDDGHRICRWYLGKLLDDQKFWLMDKDGRRSETEKPQALIRGYSEDLLQSLDLGELLLSGPNLEINIYEGVNMHPQLPTIHSLWWECLEASSLSDTSASPLKNVIVRRVIDPAPIKEVPRVTTWSKRGTDLLYINVLLVIGRKLNRDMDPSLAQMAILQAQKKLKESNRRHRIRLEIVRPGTFAEFKKHLQRTKLRANGAGYFHIVHFDTHGCTRPISNKDGKRDYQACLRFTHEDVQDKYQDIPAIVVAASLKLHRVTCAIINACDSARADQGLNANLSQVLIREGITNVLGMSYPFTDSAAKLFHEAFYMSLLHDESTFSNAVYIARSRLRGEPRRRSPMDLGSPKIIDWFIPVSYTTGVDVQIKSSISALEEDPMNPNVPTIERTATIGTIIHYILLQCHIYILHLLYRFSPTPCVMLRDRELLDVGTESSGFVQLDINLLWFEKELVERRLIFLNGPPRAGKTTLLNHLCHLWLVTGFVDHILRIDSKHFLTSWMDRRLLAMNGNPSTSVIFQLHKPPFGNIHDEHERLWLPRTMVIIDHLDEIFRDGPIEPNHRLAQQRFDRFVTKIKKDYRRNTDVIRLPYVIIVGQQEQRWWDGNFGKKAYGDGMCFFRSERVVQRRV